MKDRENEVDKGQNTTKGVSDQQSTEKEKTTEGEKKEALPEMSSTMEMLRFMDTKQRVFWMIGAFCAALTGLSLPSFALVFGEVVQTFDPKNGASLEDLMIALLKNIMAVAGTIWVMAYLNYSLMQMAAEQLTIRLRGLYLRSLLR